jgi:hypothetical protein
MSRRFDTGSSLAALGASLFCLGGCYDVEKNFDDFVARDLREGGTSSIDANYDAAGCVRTLGTEVEMLLTIAPKPFPTKPNLMRAVIKSVENDRIQLTVQSYHYNRDVLVGTPTVTDPIPVNADGSFTTPELVLDTAGEANCALPDTPVTVKVTLQGGQVCDDTVFACGVMNGIVDGLGVDLNGSTWTAKRIVDGVLPEPETNCEHFKDIEACKPPM